MLDLLNELDAVDEIETEVVDDFWEAFRGVEADDLTIIHSNIRSINKNFEEFLVYLETVKERVGVIILSETWEVKEVSRFSIPNFNIFYNESRFNQNDGLIVYIRDTLSAQVINVSLTESVLSRIILKTEKFKFGITASYRPPATDASVYIRDVHEYNKTMEKNPIEIFLGDINFNLLGDSSSSDVTNYTSMLCENGFISYINEVTRETETSKSILDHIFIRRMGCVGDAVSIRPKVIRTAFTDHYSIFVSFSSAMVNRSLENQKKIHQVDFNGFKRHLVNESWEEVMRTEDVQLSYNVFIDKIKYFLQSCTVEKILKKKFIKLKPWITRGLIVSIGNRDRLKRILIKNFSTERKEQYCRYRNRLNRLLKITKDKYYRVQMENAGNNFKKIWRTINCATNSKSAKTSLSKITMRDEEGGVIIDNEEKANLFNTFFTNIGSEMAKKIKCGNPGMLKKMGSNKIVQESIFLTPVTENEIIEVIGSLKNDTSAGPDAIQVKLIKAIHIHITKPICHIINLAFSSGSLPQQWKESIVVPVFKGGTQDDPSNYRPISLLNNLAKIFEKCLKRRFLFFFEQQGILSDRQFGFRRGVSTEDAVLSLVKDLVNSLDESKKCMTVFLDLAKAFDTVSHEILLAKLRNVGIRGVAHKLMEDYLKDRTQYVKIDDCVSNSSTILLGVPQGTVLGPLLFLIYMNDILELKNIPGKIISYADDTAVVFIGESWDTLYRTAEKCLADICGWLNINLLTLNFNKSKFITFSITCENQPDENLLFIHNEVCNLQGCTCPSILRVDEVKYLGVVIDKYLRWEAQAALLTKKLRQLMHAFYGLRDILSRQNIRMVYYSLVESILRYCIVVWGGLTINARRNLQTSQNTLIKIMLRKDRLYPTRDLYGESKLMNLENLFIYQSLMYMFSNNHPLVNYGNKYMTRLVSNESLQIPLFKKSHSQNSIFYLGPKFYNRLPLYVRKMKTKRGFKSEVKILILEGRLAFDSLI